MTTVISTKSLGVNIGPVRLLGDIDISISGSLMHGIIGPNGAGKSTLLKTLAGILDKRASTSGEIDVLDRPIRQYDTKQLSRIVSYIPQDSKLEFDFSVEQVVEFGRYPHRGRWKNESHHDQKIIDDALEATGCLRLKRRSFTSLSGGERQLVHISRIIAQDTPIVLADEPTAALDLHHQIKVLEMLRTISESGNTVIAVLHDLTQAARYCDRVHLIAQGALHSTGPPKDVLSSAVIRATYDVDAAVRHDSDTGSIRVTPISAVPQRDR